MANKKNNRKTIKTGIIGSGFAASFHFDALLKIWGIDIEITGVYSPNRKHRESFAEARGIPALDSVDQLIEKSDVVHICTPLSTHENLTIKTLEQNKYPIVEKPFCGFCGDGSPEFRGDIYPKTKVIDAVEESIKRILTAENKSSARILYAENWIYVPSIQKEREIIEKTKAQILWIRGEESHSGSHSQAYGYWKYSGGGSMIGKGCHPLTAALYLKRKEGIIRNGQPIKPVSISAQTHELTRLDNYIDKGHLRTEYHDIEDFSLMHITFDDGTIADITASEIVMGGVHNWLEVVANNHRSVCNINPNNMMRTYNPKEDYFNDIYVVEKIGTKQGWSNPSPDEDFITGYQQEMQSFYLTAAYGEPLESNSALAADTIRTIYSAYLSSDLEGRKVSINS